MTTRKGGKRATAQLALDVEAPSAIPVTVDGLFEVAARNTTKARELQLAEWDEADRVEAASRKKPRAIGVGDYVRFTASSLRSMYGGRAYKNLPNSTGDNVGDCAAAPDQRFTVVECGCGLCKSGRMVAVDQQSAGYDGHRHIARAGLEHAPGRPTRPTEPERAAALAAVGMRVDGDGHYWMGE